jgi:hypothetical protein
MFVNGFSSVVQIPTRHCPLRPYKHHISPIDTSKLIKINPMLGELLLPMLEPMLGFPALIIKFTVSFK